MQLIIKSTLAAAAFALALTGSALAHDYKIGDLVIEHPTARATPPNAPVSGGYMIIRNEGSEADRLIAGSAPFAGKVEIHEMKMENDVMKMREIEGGLEIPAGGSVELKPGGYHVMFMKLNEQLKEGEMVKGTVVFQNAGEIELGFKVVAPGEMKMKHNHDH
ncbi:copper chaperone PCu(A)C [Oricola sp.]|uniref:copper chaperone PCu(A)C n=1 Tax=Oricola sp. TaxID=1979950 RepID=UPI003BAC7253